MESNKKQQDDQAGEDNLLDIELNFEGKHYTGWIRPAEKLNNDGKPVSYHVVLDKVFFGNLSHTGHNWTSDEPRPESLIQAVGNAIEKYFPTMK
jgi:hypothetical protein